MNYQNNNQINYQNNNQMNNNQNNNQINYQNNNQINYNQINYNENYKINNNNNQTDNGINNNNNNYYQINNYNQNKTNNNQTNVEYSSNQNIPTINSSNNHQINNKMNTNEKTNSIDKISDKQMNNSQKQNTYYPIYLVDNSNNNNQKIESKLTIKDNIQSYNNIEEFLNSNNQNNLNSKKGSSINQNKYPDFNQLSTISSNKNDNNNNENQNLNNPNKIITPQNLTDINCAICQKQCNQFFPNSQICFKCFNSALLKELYKKYSHYLKDVKIYVKENQNNSTYEFYMRKFLETMDKFSIYNLNVNLSILKNNIDMNKYLSVIKRNICLNCQKQINTGEFIIEIPCKCCFCSLNCLKLLFSKDIILNKLSSKLCCFCTHIYKPNELYQLGQYFQKFNLIDFSNQIIRIFNKILRTYCAKCKKRYEDNSLMQPISYYEVIDLDKNNVDNSLKPLGKYSELPHYLCLGCLDYLNQIYKKNKHNHFNCEFCGIEHNEIKNNVHNKK